MNNQWLFVFVAVLGLGSWSMLSAEEVGRAVLQQGRTIRCVVKSVEDLDRIAIVEAKSKKTHLVSLANILPLSQWPKSLDKHDQRIQEESLAFARKALVGKSFSATLLHVPDRANDPLDVNVVVGLVEFMMRGSGDWKGDVPSETVGWGMRDIGAFLVENGISPYVWNDQVAISLSYPDVLVAAQQLAQKNKAGLWATKAVLAHIEKVNAASRTRQKLLTKPFEPNGTAIMLNRILMLPDERIRLAVIQQVVAYAIEAKESGSLDPIAKVLVEAIVQEKTDEVIAEMIQGLRQLAPRSPKAKSYLSRLE